MKINGFKINGFGKVVNKEIKLSDGINIIYGKNETGKSSIQKFILAMIYGLSRLKNGKDISDYDKYKPWETEDFSGKLEYTLDNGKTYEIYREFKKKNPVIYNSYKENITKEFRMSKNKGIEFFVEQTGIDEDTFNNTSISEQEGLRLSRSSQNSVIQKISNIVSSGDESISYQKIMEKLKVKQNEEIGTERTSQRPINVVESKLYRLTDERKRLENYKENIFDSQAEKEKIRQEIKEEETKKEFLKELRTILDNERMGSAEISFNKNLENEYIQKIDEINDKLEDNSISEEYENINFRNYFISMIIFIVIFACLMIWKVRVINVLALLPIIPIAIKLLLDKRKAEYNRSQRKYDRLKMTNELDILNQNREFKKAELEEIQSKHAESFAREKESLSIRYVGLIDSSYIDEFSKKNYKEVSDEIDNKDNRINSIKFRLQTLEGRTREINNKIEELSEIEERIVSLEEERDELLALNNSYNIAKECLTTAYEKVKENISPKFTQNLCNIISKISDGRYNNIMLNDTDGLSVEIENGSYVPANRLSVGTVDQMYLSLRLSSIDEISKETMPIILDEAFAYFDEGRLVNIFKYLKENFSKNQIIIFTCSGREKEILDDMRLNYKLIEL
ncbi:MAG: AAA family ATPase [Clostridia bacterium]|nr:AAA family ATPase [Clostridia bacterium]